MQCRSWDCWKSSLPYCEAPGLTAAALLKATALAVGRGSLAQGGIGLRSDTGEVGVVANAAGLCLLGIVKQLAAEDGQNGPAPALIIEWHEEDWLRGIASFDPSVTANLSIGLTAGDKGKGDGQLNMVLTIKEAGPSLNEAKKFMESLRLLLLQPIAILA